ncbi:MAG: glycerol-3-phosphate dehydrogenase [Actinomycetota bacterium]|nr:glycerol-3-phosphate dehydrogenase [Actinomycetota bacterium]
MSTTLPTVPAGDPDSLLDAERRTRDIHRCASSTVDVLVVGGGITGVGIALDAATRGLSVALVEAHDLAYGTSRWSSKLVHGGLRYLASGQVGIAWESAVERTRIMNTIAPHLARPMAQLVPMFDDSQGLPVAAGLGMGDLLRRGAGGHLPAPSRLSAAEARELVPGLAANVTGGRLGWDGQLVDDARLVVAVARTAAAYGARILTHTRAVSLTGDGALLADEMTGETWTLSAHHVVNATGAWAAGLDDRVSLIRSRGTHLVVKSASIGEPSCALMVALPGSTSRFVFALPQADGISYIGLTDVETTEPLDDPRASEEEIQFLLDGINPALAQPLDRAQILTTYSGYRPLLASATGSSADLSRRHAVLDGDVISVVGGKLTTYRRMAEDAVDLISERPCRTRDLPLVGAVGPRSGKVPDRLSRRFGAEAAVVAAMARGDESLLEPIGSSPVLGVELLWARHAEAAITDEDVLARRLRVDLVPEWYADVAAGAAAVCG